jgi:hypothetical protein
MNLPLHFLGVGPQRTASSWLYEVLSCHPRLQFPAGVKETMYFDLRYQRGPGYYEAHFRERSAGRLLGEIGPTYFHSAPAVERVAELAPECKIIINVRNPITRSHSLFRHHLSKGRVPNSFEAALAKLPEILESGRYARHAPRWESWFGREQVLYLVQEDIERDPAAVLHKVCAFLQVDPLPVPAIAADTKFNTAAAPRHRWLARTCSLGARMLRAARLHRVATWGKSLGLRRVYQGGGPVDPLSPEMYRYLAAEYAADIDWLEQRLGRRFPQWRKVPETDTDGRGNPTEADLAAPQQTIEDR